MLEVCFNQMTKNDLVHSKIAREQNVAAVLFELSNSDINSHIISAECLRKVFLRSQFSLVDRDETYFNEFYKTSIDDLEKIKAETKAVRVWLDDTPDARCGLLFLANLFCGSETQIYVVHLEKVVEGATTLTYRSFGDVESKRLCHFLSNERTLSKVEVETLAKEWQRLEKENAPLRVVEDNKVLSAELSYYDEVIRQECKLSPCKIFEIIGRILAMHEVLISDVFIASRLKSFIDSGELKVLNCEGRFYEWVVINTLS